METKVCKQCNIKKEIFNFHIRKDTKKPSYRKICKDCKIKNRKINYENNKNEISILNKKNTIAKNLELKINKLKDKICEQCNINKNYSNFYLGTRKIKSKNICNDCKEENRKNYRKKYKEKYKLEISQDNKNYYNKNKKIIIEKNKEHNERLTEENLEKIRLYRANHFQENKEEIYKKRNVHNKERYKNDLIYRLKKIISTAIRRQLKNNGISKGKKSCKKYLDYSLKQLKEYLENLFEPWMNWNNHGKYNSKTFDNNPTWQIDHIIPQSDLPYASMEDENFKKCWKLSNLRPLSSKINLLDGVNKVRHKK